MNKMHISLDFRSGFLVLLFHFLVIDGFGQKYNVFVGVFQLRIIIFLMMSSVILLSFPVIVLSTQKQSPGGVL